MVKNDLTYFFSAFFLIAIIIVGTIFALSIMGCSSKENEIQYKERVVLNYVPVPTKCDLNISRPPVILTDTLQNRVKSLTELAFDGVELREILKNVPCLNINYIGDFLN